MGLLVSVNNSTLGAYVWMTNVKPRQHSSKSYGSYRRCLAETKKQEGLGQADNVMRAPEIDNKARRTVIGKGTQAFSKVLEKAPYGVALVNQKGKYCYVNAPIHCDHGLHNRGHPNPGRLGQKS